ncbi:MAG: NAD(P)-dependent alcohol dehydrogenase [Candidatus Odinarchaeota archaeon]
MKAVVYTKYGPPEVLQLQEVKKPIPKDNEVLIKIFATTVNFGDLIARNFTKSKFHMPLPLWPIMKLVFGIRKPRKKILGNEFSGEIEAIGKNVTKFKVDDPIIGYSGQGMGAYAEYIVLPETAALSRKPNNMKYEEAAVVPMGSMMALGLLKKIDIQPGQKILINGASGGIGSAAVQLSKHYFGAEVTGICGTPRLEFVKSLGADKVIDYTREDFTQNSETYDFIFDILGLLSFGRVKNSLKSGGTLLYASFGMRTLGRMIRTKLFGSKKVICAMSSDNAEDLREVVELIEAGTIKAVIDRRFPLEQTAEAHQYIEEGHKKGNVVITVVPNNKT